MQELFMGRCGFQSSGPRRWKEGHSPEKIASFAGLLLRNLNSVTIMGI